MSDDEDEPVADYWDRVTEIGVSSTWTFHGQEGLERLSGIATFTTTDVAGFTARLTRVQLDHVALEAFEASPHRSVERGEAAEGGAALMIFLLAVEGAMRIEVGGAGFDVAAGQCCVLDSRQELAYLATEPVRLLRSVVAFEHVPPALRARGTGVPGVLRRTSMVDGFIAFISSILTTTAAGSPAAGEHLIRAVAELQSAVLSEAQRGSSVPQDGPAVLRTRMEGYIQTHYSDPDLGPSAIAEVFGISLRQAHVVFGDAEHTLARFIREQRLTAAAQQLRTESRMAPLSHLARQVGFRNPDTFSSAFRNRYGMSPADYRAGGHRHLG